LFTGKGGVGKTTVAAATALRAAASGRRTLLMSTDPSHSLGDALDRPLGSAPAPVEPCLWAQQLDVTERFEEAWGEVQSYLVELIDWAGVEGIEAEELAIIPGLEEIFALSEIKTVVAAGGWDLLVVDCAPTAETIRLLSLPDVLAWYMERMLPVGRRVTRAVRPLVSAISSLPVAKDSVFAAASRFYDRLTGVRDILTDAERTSVRLLVNPERLVIAEARRTATYLSLFGYHVDAIIANRLLPDTVQDPWFSTWKDVHAEHLAAIEKGFAPIPVLRAELAAGELVGVDALAWFACRLYGERDVAAVLHRDDPARVEARGAGFALCLALPFVERGELEVARSDGEIHVRVGPYRRAVVLPDSLARRPFEGAKLVGDRLEVRFGTAQAGRG